MDKEVLNNLVKEAQVFLVNNPQDYAHDITHHYRTWLNAKLIANSINEEIEPDVLELICWWHDVQTNIKPKENERVCKVTAEYLSSKFDGKVKDIIFDSVMFHEFGSNPKYTEGKILQDADKLELLSDERFRLAINAIKAGKLSRDYFLGRVLELKKDWLPKMPTLYNFDISRSLHNERLSKLDLESYIEELKDL